MTVAGRAESPKLVPFSVGTDSFVNGMSHNGRWATYERQAGEETVTFDVKLIDMQTGEFISYTPKQVLDYAGRPVKINKSSFSQPFGASDDGKIIYGSACGYPAYFTVDDLTWHSLSMGTPSMNRNNSGAVYGWSQDGRVLCGWFSGDSMTDLYSALWVDGEIKELPALPTYQDMYDLGIIDTSDFAAQRNLTPNFTFRQVSDDGKILLLGIDHNRPQWGCSYGIYNIEKDTFEFLLAPYEEYGQSFTDGAVMSPNGEWASGNMYFMGQDINGADDSDGIFLYHIPTGKMEIYNDVQSNDLLVTAVDNEGTIFATTPASNPIRSLVVRSENLWVDLGKILDQKYGFDYYKESGYPTSGYAVAVSRDGKTILSQAEFRGSAYSLTMPVNFAEAAKGTSLLTEYMVSPLDGQKFSELKNMMIRFTYTCEPAADALVTVKDEAGNVVGKSKAITPFSSQKVLYTITFDDVPLEEGKKYTVNIPANTFRVGDTSMGNPEINVTYVGRENVPVVPGAIEPAQDSYINVFSYNNPVTVDFGVDLSATTSIQPALYEVGHDAPLCNLSVSIEGSTLVIFPASERRLSKDREYIIKVPEGLVYDLSGCGPNAAFDIRYFGAYVPTPVEDPARPFFEDFNSPNDAMFNFLLFDGDQLLPTPEMENFGFDRSNTPWNFSIRDDGNYNYCAASHSLYDPEGESDDWMIIPQLSLTDGDYFLTFKGQSYDAGRTDVLKIYVWENDEVYGSVDESLFKTIKSEAKLLAEVTLQPSLTKGTLEGSWVDYEFPLSEYSGKKIYIALVNQNEEQSLVFIDDLAVEYRGAYTLTVAADSNLIQADSTDITAYVNVNVAGPFDTVEATIELPESDYKSSQTLTGLNLTAGDRQAIEFKDVLLEEGTTNPFVITTKVGGLEQSYKGNIVNHAFEINRRVLLEEGTGMWCGNCPLGEVAIENLEATMPDNIAVISVHNGDAFVMTDYDQMLALGGYPAGRINRIDKVFQPAYSDETTGYKELTSPDGNMTFKDMVMSEIAAGTEGEIKIVDPVFYSADDLISVPVDVRFSVSRKNTIYNVFTCVVEGGLEGKQSNYFTGDSSPILEWWSAQPRKVDYTYHNVARAMVNGFYGKSGLVPANVVADQKYHADIRFELPENVENTDNMHFVVALIDATTGMVINSDVCKNFTINPTKGAGVDGVQAEGAEGAVLTVENGTIFVNGSDNVEVYTTAGMQVRNDNLDKGAYIVRKIMEDGSVFSKLIMVR